MLLNERERSNVAKYFPKLIFLKFGHLNEYGDKVFIPLVFFILF
jgi:hypothetical protein